MVSFLCMIDPGISLKLSGNGTGGKIVLAFDNTQVPEAMKTVLLQERLLRVTLEGEEDVERNY